MKHPSFTIFKSEKDGQYYFRLKAKNGRIILASEGYTAKHNCEQTAALLRQIVYNPSLEIKLWNNDNEWWFRIVGGNFEIVGTSETYTTKAGAKRGISSVRKNAPIAEIVDLTKD